MKKKIILILLLLFFMHGKKLCAQAEFETLYEHVINNDWNALKNGLNILQMNIESLSDTEQYEFNFFSGIFYFNTNDYKTAQTFLKKSAQYQDRAAESNFYLNLCENYLNIELLQAELKPDIFNLINIKKLRDIDTGPIQILHILPRNYIRVLLKSSEKTQITVSEGCKITAQDGNIIETFDSTKKYTIKYKADKYVSMSDVGKYSELKVIPADGGGIQVDNHNYIYPVKLVPIKVYEKVYIVLEIPLEEYLKSVIPLEIGFSWPFEMLKAQSIAARTYASYQMLACAAMPYDVKSDESSQMFGGHKTQKNTTNRAVNETQNIIMTYFSRPILAYFHASSGGAVDEPSELWGGGYLPYFRAETDEFYKQKSYNWNVKIKEKN